MDNFCKINQNQADQLCYQKVTSSYPYCNDTIASRQCYVSERQFNNKQDCSQHCKKNYGSKKDPEMCGKHCVCNENPGRCNNKPGIPVKENKCDWLMREPASHCDTTFSSNVCTYNNHRDIVSQNYNCDKICKSRYKSGGGVYCTGNCYCYDNPGLECGASGCKR